MSITTTFDLPEPADVLLADGSVACIRPLRHEDHAELLALNDAVSDDSLRLRFFAANRNLARTYVEHIFAPEGRPILALVAVVDGCIEGVATADLEGTSAEVAFLVADRFQGRGLGSLLLEHLAAACRKHEVRLFTADVLPENHRMMRVFLDAGFVADRQAEDGVMQWHIHTSPGVGLFAAADRRERHAEALSLAPLLHPRCVAVVGVRSRGGGIGRAVLCSISEGGFTGDLFVVHPTATEIEGAPAVRSLADVPQHVDVAVIAVPALTVLDAVRDAAAAAASAVVIISSGFSELGPRGAEIQRHVLRIARDHNIRLVGPNCLGLLCNDPSTRLNATFSGSVPPPGGLAIASQSGGVGIALLDLARELGLGVQSFVSLGNKADVSGNDLLAAWRDDQSVTAAALYLESFGNAPKFARVARDFSECKPLLAVVGGRSAGGVRGGASHTAAAASPTVGVNALFAQAGVITCSSAEEMARIALLASEQPLPRGPRVAVVSNAGGIGVLASDAADDHGLVVPELSVPLRAQLRKHVSGTVGVSNPIDLGAGADADDLSGVLEVLLESDEIDALVVAIVATRVTDPAPLVDVVSSCRTRRPELPVLLVAMGGLEVDPDASAGVTVFSEPSRAIAALAAMTRYATWRALPRESADPPDEERAAQARACAQRLLEKGGSQSWLSHAEQHDLLEPYGLAPLGRVAANPVEAAEIATQLGFPVVLKVADPTVVHKTDRGLVRVGLQSVPEVLTTVRAFEQELGATEVQVLVQPMTSGVEIALGMVRDPGFGPLVMVAAGGVATGIWNDRAFLMPPITTGDASRALGSLRIWPLLAGFRGAAACDIQSLERIVLDLGRLAAEVPQIAEMDLNPVMVLADGAHLVDVKVRLAPGDQVDAGFPHRLRA